MKKYIFLIIILVLLLLGSLYNLKQNKPTSTKKLQVTASFYPIYFFTSKIAANKADVKNITPSGVEPHDYEPTAQTIAEIENSDLLVMNGGGLEPWGDKVKENLKNTKTNIIITGDSLADKKMDEEGETITDPHVWLSPPLAKIEIKKILDAFINLDLKNKDYYSHNASLLLASIDELDSSYKSGLANCKQKDIITSHAAFGYLAQAYGLHQVPISGLSHAEPSAKQLAEVADFARKNDVKYIFFESLVSPKLSETVANEIGAKTLVLDPIEGISDEDQKAGQNYLTVMKNNLKNLKIALECQ